MTNPISDERLSILRDDIGLEGSAIAAVIARLELAEKERDFWKHKHMNATMAEGALAAIHEMLDEIGVPRGTFAGDHVLNLVAIHNRMKELVESNRGRLGPEFEAVWDANVSQLYEK